MTRSYVHPSHVEIAETTGYRPTRDELLEEQEAVQRRRRRAEQARNKARKENQ